MKQVKGYPLSGAYTCKNYEVIYEEVATDQGGLASIFIHVEKQTKFTIYLQRKTCALLLFTKGSVVIDFTEEHSQLLFQWQTLSIKQDDKLDIWLLPGSYEWKIIQINSFEHCDVPTPVSQQALNSWPKDREISTVSELLINEIRSFEKENPSTNRYGTWIHNKFTPLLAAYLQLKTLVNEPKKPWPKDRLGLITTYIKQNLCDNITDIGLCTTYHLTEAELEKIFFDEFRCSVRRYVTEQRMKTANEILYVDAGNIAEIASRVGYKQVNTFISDYEDHYGSIRLDKQRKKYL
jgi:AraC-like DNA-binding protein